MVIIKTRYALLASLALFMLTSCSTQKVPNTETLAAAKAGKTVSMTTAAEVLTTTSASTSTTTETTTTTAAETTTSSQTTAAASAASTAAPTTVAETTTTAAPETTAAPTETTTQPAQPTDKDSWMLILVNKDHSIGNYAPPELTDLFDGSQVDSRIYPDLQNMYDDMRALGFAPYTREGYRTYDYQQYIMDTRIAQHLSEGYSEEGAKEQAEKYVAVPGTSEHQLGLAVDINASDGNETGLYNWLSQYAYQYGFILRYPQGKEYSTGYEYEPWHYRYVGKEAAAYIHNNNITLEEYLGY